MSGLTLAVAVAMLTSAYGGLIDPRRWALPSVATLALPLVTAGTVVWLLITLVTRQWRCSLITAAAVAGSWGPVTSVIPVGLGSTPLPESESSSRTFTLIQFNVGGLGFWTYNRKRQPNKIFTYILKQDPDIVIMQETSLSPIHYEDIPAVNVMLDSINDRYPYREHGYHDVVILSKFPYTRQHFDHIDPCYIDPDCTSEYNFDFEAYDVMMPGEKVIRIMGCHLHPIGLRKRQKQLFKEVTDGKVRDRSGMEQVKSELIDRLLNAYVQRAGEAQLIRTAIDMSGGDLVMCGDFNDTPASWCYRTILGDDMHDAYRELHRGYLNTYREDRFLFHIDHVLYRGDLRAVSYERGESVTSDHYSQIVKFEYNLP